MNILNKPGFQKSKKLTLKPKHDYAFPIYTQRRSDIGVTVICPDMNITRTLPLPQAYNKITDFYADLIITMAEVDSLALEEFKKRDQKTNKKHRKRLFPRGLKDHLEIDIHKLMFKPPQAAILTTQSTRTWQRWCKKKLIKRKANGLKFERNHYLIPFSEIEPYLKQEFINYPELLKKYVT